MRIDAAEMERRALRVLELALVAAGGNRQDAFGSLIAAVSHLIMGLPHALGDTYVLAAIRAMRTFRIELAKYKGGLKPHANLYDNGGN